MRYLFDVGAVSDQHRRMGMAEIVRAYRSKAGIGGSQVNDLANVGGKLSAPKMYWLVIVQCSL